MADKKSEEIDLNSRSSKADPKVEESDPTVNNMAGRIPDLTSLVTPGGSADELLDKILDLAPEQLISWEDCTIPSLGLYYGWPDGKVKIKPMGQTAEKILATQRLAQSGQSIDYLFRECLRLPNGFDPVDLLLGDRIFLLYYLRGITHGEMYEFALTCPNNECASLSTHQYNLTELAKTITWARPELGPEPFKIELPYLSKSLGTKFWVGVRFLRASDANDMLSRRKLKQKAFAKPGASVRTRTTQANHQAANRNQMLDETINQNLEKIIVSAMGVSDPFKMRRLIEKLHAQDSAAIREWLRENTPGIDNTVSVVCPDCGNEFTVELPITESFFRPSKS